jgi:hypothetical protein
VEEKPQVLPYVQEEETGLIPGVGIHVIYPVSKIVEHLCWEHRDSKLHELAFSRSCEKLSGCPIVYLYGECRVCDGEK